MSDVKEPTHSSKRAGREVPSVVAVLRALGRTTFALKRAFAHMRMWLNKITYLLTELLKVTRGSES